ncbi:MAG: phosphoribosylaminoimidazolesuccinocarboxamide synthase [Alphaproteobacteria bacterium]|nr:phosphoribosylaminoimidazolesuccinocarboxamide synthase [Alphaproteobacteria bacterium]
MKTDLLYETEHKEIFNTKDPNLVWIQYKNESRYGSRDRSFTGKAMYNNKINGIINNYLAFQGIVTSYVKDVSDTEQLCKKLSNLPLKFIVRNFLMNAEATKYNLESSFKPSKPIIELYLTYPYDNDIFVNDSIIHSLDIVPHHELNFMYEQVHRINLLMYKYWLDKGIILSDFELYFGKDTKDFICLANELTPDYCNLWERQPSKLNETPVPGKHLNTTTDVYLELFIKMIR